MKYLIEIKEKGKKSEWKEYAEFTNLSDAMFFYKLAEDKLKVGEGLRLTTAGS